MTKQHDIIKKSMKQDNHSRLAKGDWYIQDEIKRLEDLK